MSARILLAAAVACCVYALAGCDLGQSPRGYSISGIGNAQHGKQLIRSYGCGACHTIPGVRAARGLVGPPLYFFGERTMIAGQLPNTPENLTRWIEHPRQIEPKTAMPDLGVSASEAYDIAAYLYTLRQGEGTSWMD
jgi:cytochrome c1